MPRYADDPTSRGTPRPSANFSTVRAKNAGSINPCSTLLRMASGSRPKPGNIVSGQMTKSGDTGAASAASSVSSTNLLTSLSCCATDQLSLLSWGRLV